MILRGVIYADQPRSLLRPEPQSGKVPVSEFTTSPLALAQTTVTQPVSSRERFILSEVNEWISKQDELTRQAVAHGLSGEIDKLSADAIAEGRVAGADAAKAEVKAQYAAGLEVIRSLAEKSEKLFEQQCEQLSLHCADIVGEALSKLVGPALVRPEACLEATRTAVAYVRGARELVIRVSQKDEPMMLLLKGEIAEAFGSNSLSIVSDPRVTSGGCLVESSFGDIDARWETKLISLVKVLREAGGIVAEHKEQRS